MTLDLFQKEDQHNNGPVTVLGKTFANDEERRAYFREELRKKLPELKEIEGFPIGDDEDIINLSDPPFYTACPNPWINDFIAEWEEEKKQLEKEGKRVPDFEVSEPYAADVSEGKNDPLYNAHSYHTKVPPKAIMRYLLHYTQPGDIVYDGFGGSGMTGVASNNLSSENEVKQLGFDVQKGNVLSNNNVISKLGKRNSIISDISPAATHLSYNNSSSFNVKEFENHANRILNKTIKEFEWMFQTVDPIDNKLYDVEYFVWSEISTCSSCDGDLIFSQIAFDESYNLKEEILCPKCNSQVDKRKLVPQYETVFDNVLKNVVENPKREVVLICYKKKSKKHYKKPDSRDIELIDKINQLSIDFRSTYEIPDMQMMRVGRMKSSKIEFTHQFFTKRILYIISYMWNEANKIEDKRIKEIIRYWLDSHFVNLSYRNRYRPNVSFPYNPMTGVFYIPMMCSEPNPFVAYKNKIRKITTAFIDYIDSFSILSTNSAVLSQINTNSIDYIFTDPPFGENIYYSDLNFFTESWYKVFTETKTEAIVDKVKNKNEFVYNDLVTSSFKDYFRVLKPGNWMTVVFSNTKASIWNGIQLAITNSGFVIANVAALDKKQGTFQAVNTTTAVKQDLVISCYKPSSEFDTKFQASQHSPMGVWDFVEEHLSHLPIHLVKDNATTAVVERSAKILFDRLIAFYVQRSLPVPIDAGKFQEGLKERFVERDGMYFTQEQVEEYERKKAEVPEFIQMSLFVGSEQDAVYWLRQLLEKEPKTEQDLHPLWMREVAGNMRKGDSLPEMRQILEENFLKDDTGKWYVPDIHNAAQKQQLREKRLLKIFEDYKTEAAKPKGKLKEVRVEALRVGFKQCYQDKDFKTIVTIGDRIPNNLLMEDEVLLQFYDIASAKI
ncbi:DNA methyltransferase [Empedobacter sp. GD03739]|uniref:DNA methyltransferase n=1 Tax=Empedobacter sp. GD03739 TaxID=2975376 RepID=UPI00244C3279|nr:DNA methyltransferase [Empedobacter sp. GD03739]MDH1603513.1 site-specific DNA-methyltransferase [Empedobacter sp. GD03739]